MKARKKDTKVIVTQKRGFDLDVKRFHFPVLIKTKCPHCGAPCQADYRKEDYVSGPVLGKPQMTHWLCPNDHEFSVNLTFRLIVEV